MNEKAIEDREASVIERVLSQKLVKDLSKNQDSFREVSKKMSKMMTQQATSKQSNAASTIVERSRFLEEDNQNLLIHVTVCSAKIDETLERLGAARHENIELKQNLEDKTAVCQDLCKDNASQKDTLEWQKYALDDLIPKQHAMELYLKHLTIK